MTPNDLIGKYSGDPRTIEVSEALNGSSHARFSLKGLIGSSRTFVTASIFKQTPRVHLAILPDRESAAYFLNDLEQIFDEISEESEKKRILFFPSSFKKGVLSGAKDNQGLLLRTEVLNRLNNRAGSFFIVTYPEALAEKVVNRKFLEKNTLKLSSGEKVSMDFILDLLVEYDFERADFVLEPGQFALRGGLIDVYSFSSDHPYRIEFSGDNIASIRTFDPAAQLSLNLKESITIVPDIRVNEEKKTGYEPLLGFLPEGSVIWLEDTGFCADRLDELTGSDLLMKSSEFLPLLLDSSSVEFGRQFYFKSSKTIIYNTSPQPSFNKNFDLLTADLADHAARGYANVILADGAKQAERLRTILEDLEASREPQTVTREPLTANRESQITNHESRVTDHGLRVTDHGSRVTDHGSRVTVHVIHEGFVDHDLKLLVYTDHQIFERYHHFHLRDGYTSKEALTLKEIYDLKPGDYVTHIDHGVGRFDGLEKIMNNGKEQEAIRLIYKNEDVLYVSIHSLHRISKYIGKEGSAPVLNRLGSDSWTKLKARTKGRVKDIARDLIKLYAERRATEGFAYTPDTYLQTELEASFIYEDTPDQIKSTVDVKKDLEAGFPMDRLVCGDVGFGKTEIAIRAAFKVVADSKQVAVLVPTTILALQHFKTFSERLKDFPCRVDYINRFRSAKSQSGIIKDLAEGKIDILIGTHRLLGKELTFKDLGLLIIDEEQKFGVAAKEKMKRLRVNVDTLTLTATPIPRTLQFSLMGARDLSIINTPPPNRYPVQTEIHSFHEDVFKEAISNELSRGGQVFVVNTRVQNIGEVAGMIQRLVPSATVAVAHGQMDGPKLEKVMMDFIEGEFDVLVATTIIESGLDIPNVNTIIINDAHHYGLSDLHQLRGRVGRSNRKAFCYLIAPPMTTLTDEAKKRLKAIEEFSELGSGFSIAMRDLDIRGAGNILGAEQSGFITEIGFEMYQKILDEALSELKEQDFGELFKDLPSRSTVKDCVIETDMEILIPDAYVTNITERLNLYKELDSIEAEKDLEDFRSRLADRFGTLPPQTDELLQTIRLRKVAKNIGFEKLILRKSRMNAYFPSNPDSTYYNSGTFGKILEIVKDPASGLKLKQEGSKLFLTFRETETIAQGVKKLENMMNAM